MNKSNMEMKYILGVWKSLPEYPTRNDVLYEILNHKKKNADQFSDDILDNIWKDEQRLAVREIISGLVEENIVEKLENGYRVLVNPFI